MITMITMITMIQKIAFTHAAETIREGTSGCRLARDTDGKLLLSRWPMEGGALADELRRDPTDDERAEYATAYRLAVEYAIVQDDLMDDGDPTARLREENETLRARVVLLEDSVREYQELMRESCAALAAHERLAAEETDA